MTDRHRDNRAGGDSDDEPKGDLRHRAKRAGAALLHYTVTGVLLAATLAVGVWGLLAPPDPDPEATTTDSPTAIQRAQAASTRTRIEGALEVHRIESKRFSGSLGALVDRGLLRSDDLSYPRGGRHWTYATTDGGFRLTVEDAPRE